MSIRPSWPGAAPTVLIPLHKGADAFMSIDHFRKFYWPSLKQLILGIVEAGVIPILLVEASYNNARLDLIAASGLPGGKTIWLFEKSDMQAVRDRIGPWACIAGNISTSILAAGKPEDIEDQCRRLIETVGRGGGYILSTVASIDHATPENVRAFLRSADKYGVYR